MAAIFTSEIEQEYNREKYAAIHEAFHHHGVHVVSCAASARKSLVDQSVSPRFRLLNDRMIINDDKKAWNVF